MIHAIKPNGLGDGSCDGFPAWLSLMEEKMRGNLVDLSLKKMNSILMREKNQPISNRLRRRSDTE